MIEGGQRLHGKVKVSGAKNSSLPILVATLLADSESVVRNVPDLEDVNTLMEILRNLGLEIERFPDGAIRSRVVDNTPYEAPYEHVQRMRASVLALGPLVARRGHARISLPGGCVIGTRPIDLHIKGLEALGAKIEVRHGYVEAQVRELVGTRIYLGGAYGSTVLGTANIMMAATLAKGRTVIENAACEPEVVDLARFLNAMGAEVSGIGSHRLVIDGVEELHGADHTVIPDRIEAGTFMAAGAITGGDVTIEGVCPNHLMAVVDKFIEAGVSVDLSEPTTGNIYEDSYKGSIRVRGMGGTLSTDITTLPYPGYPTDLQAQFMAMLAVSGGISVVTEKVYPDRFMHVAEYCRMGAKIRKEGPSAILAGVPGLSGAPVKATDLRASAGLVLMGLVALGKSEIHHLHHIDRGYEKLEEKLHGLGAKIWREAD
ncbi:MAG: UDP-N-acetylglucosamine 1-carboxyvinyltransferase [Planctomycetota bacterium]|jgi:UDP-N-acetylglucosamine 1-carboxyvinyltransferase|nr:UDP-N-acetylglucosamine 1-carboxyvinyltransferase [Planctomycetota bacterium]